MDEEIYKENILDHNRNPHNKKVLADFDLKGEGKNVSCGDAIALFVKFGEDGKVLDVGFKGDGCAISQAATSMLTDKIKGMREDELKLISPGDIYDMLGIRISLGRTKCALLPYEALIDSLKNV
ncbi:Putative iron-sulfur cluster assembly scaffold protein for SUF system, SufE2 [hydrothermal vent metagenome]|uniref:Iron-sulfur cluster assembly scaffold protein for SUF system, SufE2 n=1 Tax=hydrothermal vent metagenome TaxID=652676 RepID=A0A3B0TAT1_9ZZZZ